MGWSNDIPNPLDVGGSGQVGTIQILNAANELIGKIDDTGIWVYSPPNDGYMNIANAGFGIKPPIDPLFGYVYIEGEFVSSSDFLSGQPETSIYSPEIDDPGSDYSQLTLAGNIPGVLPSEFYAYGELVTLAGISLSVSTTNLSFFFDAPAPKQTVVGSRGGNAALASLLTALATYGLITNNTTP